jgi:transposase
MNATTYAVDLAKNVFQVHWVEPASGEIHRKQLSRAKLTEFFAQRQPARIAMEACGSAHHWARTLTAMGHEPELLPAKQVRAFVRGNKDDAADARAIWVAASHDDIRRVPIKSCEQQSILSLHRIRSHWINTQTSTINMLRGLVYEFGVVLPQGRHAGLRALAERRAQINESLPELMVRLVDDLLRTLKEIGHNIEVAEGEIAAVQKSSQTAKALRQIPGIGVLGATALAAVLGDGKGWRNGREFAASLGLIPGHQGTGGKVRMGGITKRGDPYLRTLLISGAHAVAISKSRTEWFAKILERRPANVAAVAWANKAARMAWALVRHGRAYDASWKSSAPAAA